MKKSHYPLVYPCDLDEIVRFANQSWSFVCVLAPTPFGEDITPRVINAKISQFSAVLKAIPCEERAHYWAAPVVSLSLFSPIGSAMICSFKDLVSLKFSDIAEKLSALPNPPPVRYYGEHRPFDWEEAMSARITNIVKISAKANSSELFRKGIVESLIVYLSGTTPDPIDAPPKPSTETLVELVAKAIKRMN